MSVAGIWDTWHPCTPDERRSFSILTTAANEFMRVIHDRMPVILGRSVEETWLDPEIHEQDALQEMLKPCRSSWLTVCRGKNSTRRSLCHEPTNSVPR